MGGNVATAKNAFRLLLSLSVLLLFVLISVFIYQNGEQERIYRTIHILDEYQSQVQRWVKLEYAQVPLDGVVEEMDILLEVLGTEPKDGGARVASLASYDVLLEEVERYWALLLVQVDIVRESGLVDGKLMYISERHYGSVEGFRQVLDYHLETYKEKVDFSQQCVSLNILFTFMMLVSQGISYMQLAQKNKEISRIMYQDMHTGLYNKSRCVSLMEEKEELGEQSTAAIVVFDLNDLKKVNDNLGHAFGDDMIFQFARCLKQAGELQHHLPFMGRYGGDEFIVFFEETLGSTVDEYLTLVEHYVKLANDGTEDFTISFARGVGCATESQGNVRLSQLLHDADKAMYEHKVWVKGKQEKKEGEISKEM